MNRAELRQMGLSEEQVKKIMDINGADIEEAKQAGAADKQRADDLQNQLTQLTNDLAEAQKTSGDITALQQQLQAAQDALAANRKAMAIRDALADYKPRNPDLLARLLDSDKITVNPDGTLIGLREQIEPLKTNSGYLFSDTPDSRGGITDVGKPGGGFDFNSFLRGDN